MRSHLILAILVGLPLEAAASPNGTLQVQVLDDLGAEAGGVAVEIQQDGQPVAAVSTSSSGLTSTEEVSLSALVTKAVLEETATASGILLGQVYDVELRPLDPQVDEQYQLFTFTQPVIEPTFISSTLSGIYSVGNHDRWDISRMFNSEFRYTFWAHVGMLINENVIDRYQAYNQVQFPALSNGSYKVATVIRSQTEDLGPDGMVLTINCNGYGFTSPPNPAALFLSEDTNALANATFSVDLLFWEDGYAYLAVSGQLGRGDNIILITDATTLSTVVPLQANRLDVTPSPPIAFNQDCVVEAPEPTQLSCDEFGSAPHAKCSVVADDPVCKTKTERIGGPRCGVAGASHSKTINRSWKVSFSIPVVVSGHQSGIDVEFSGSDETNVGTAFGPGENGCGECFQDFKHFYSCAKKYTLTNDKLVVIRVGGPGSGDVIAHIEPCASVTTIARVCKGETDTTTDKCDRSCN